MNVIITCMKESVSPEVPPEEISEVLLFWFGNLLEDAWPDEEKRKMWWMKSKETDDLIRERFGRQVALAEKGELSGWLDTPEGTLAFIIVVDQFPRNIRRDTSEAFSLDSLALGVCLESIEKGFDKSLHPAHRTFFYLPLMHSEDPEIQRLSVEKYSTLENEFAELSAFRQELSCATDFARRHFDIIKRFGRYPHRNAALGRESTSEEIEFLKQPGSSF